MSNVQKKDNLTELILDEHGNYVVQKVLSLSDLNMQRAMLRIIVPLVEKLKYYSYGERVINRLMNAYPMINEGNFLLTSLFLPSFSKFSVFCFFLGVKDNLFPL